jgi:hypothetical protein
MTLEAMLDQHVANGEGLDREPPLGKKKVDLAGLPLESLAALDAVVRAFGMIP